MVKIQAITNNLSFGRKLTKKEEEGYTKAVNDSLKALNKEVGIIIHHSSAPSDKASDTGIGSLYSEASRNMVLPFLQKHNFTTIQLEPETTRKFGDPSPYSSISTAYNPLMQDLKKLTTKEYGKILSEETFKNIVENNPNYGKNRTNYDYVNSRYEQAFREAWENFKNGDSKEIKALQKEFEIFKEENKDVENIALYNALCKENGNSYWENWESEFDKYLFEQNPTERQGRIDDIKKRYEDDMNYTYFVQMLVSKTRKSAIDDFKSHNIKTIADAPVAFSDVEVWSNPNLFMKGYKMGCAPDCFSSNGQAWGFAVINPATLFDEKGNLKEGGKFLFNKYQKLFKENKGGVRIDHVVGLIDPFVYKNTPLDNDAGRVYSNKENPDFAPFYKKTPEELGEIMQKIIIPAAESTGLDKDDIICEDLGVIPDRIRLAFNKLGLRGISLTQYVTNKEMPKENIAMIGSHDSDTIINYTEDLFNSGDPYNHSAWALTEDVLPEDSSHDTKQAYFDDMRFDFNKPNAKEKFMASKFAQLFTSPSRTIQIFWPDVMGMNERYNKPGTNGSHNWTLRMKENFEEEYHKNLEKGHGLNLAEALEIAMKQKGDKFTQENAPLIKELEKYKEILKERE